MAKIKKFFFATIIVFTTLVALDLVLHAAAFVIPSVDNATSILSAKIPDDKLGHRPNPAYPDHDEKGFRNPMVPATVDIVALGDSQTYGSGVKADQSWPRVLETMESLSVYNMGLGGYGPVHSLLLWDEAIEMKPEIVIEAIYSGNDLYDAFSMVYLKEKTPNFKTKNQDLLATIAQMENSEPIEEHVSKMYRRGKTKSELRLHIKSWLIEHSRVYGLIKRTQYELSRMRKKNRPPRSKEDKWEKARSFAHKYSDYAQDFSSQNSRTIFTSEYRLAALNIEDPRIHEGQRISLEALRRMQQLAIRDSVRFIVLLIPTKELVFSKQADELGAPSYQSLIRIEQRFWKETRDFLDQNSIEYIDTLPSLQTALENGPQPYMVTHNGHPNKDGQKVIARTVASYLAANKPGQVK